MIWLPGADKLPKIETDIHAIINVLGISSVASFAHFVIYLEECFFKETWDSSLCFKGWRLWKSFSKSECGMSTVLDKKKKIGGEWLLHFRTKKSMLLGHRKVFWIVYSVV